MPHKITEEDSMMEKKVKEKYTGPRVKDTETFIQKARWVHGDVYDYSKVEYINSRTKVEIVCGKHGNFWQTPGNHSHGFGCEMCRSDTLSDKFSKDTNWFIEEASKTHKNSYDYSHVRYTNSKNKVTIICPTHGRFKQRAYSHIRGQGCPECADKHRADSRAFDTKWFERKAREIHGYKYDYTFSKYKRNNIKVKIICMEHGEFYQTPNSHLSGQGCRLCGFKNCGSNKNSMYGIAGYYGTSEESKIYILLLNKSFLKVGLAKDISKRMYHIRHESGYSVEKLYSISGKANELFELEQKILRKSNLKRFYPEVSFGGQSECLELSELPKVLQIIEEWEKNQQPEEEIEEDA